MHADRGALFTATMNLLDNAVKYSPPRRPVRIEVAADGDDAVVSVSDDGPGIPAHETERIFERFYRVDKARSRQMGGTGLGLSIVKHFAASLRGTVSVRSEPGKGSTFRVELPLA